MKKFLGACMLSLTLLAGCTTNPVTGVSEFRLISPQQEVSIGSQHYLPNQQSQGGRYVVDPDLTVYINEVGQRLAAVSDRPNLPYEFVVLNNDVPNAWALPGGKIAINRGLLLHLEDESQLAAVLAHEVVHAAASHSANQLTRSTLLGLGTQVAAEASRGSEYGALIALGTNLSAAAWQARYGRQHELDADRYGMTYMARAGYDPQGAVELQETFVKLSGGARADFISGLFASHPPSQERVEANRAHARTLASGTRNRERYQRAIAQLRKDAQAYEFNQQAVAAVQRKELDKALTLVDKAIAIQPKEAHFWETKAHILRMQERNREAITAFDRAVSLNPEYFSPWLGRGMLHHSQDDLAAAEQDLLRSQQWLNTAISNYLLGEVKLGMGQTPAAIEYFKIAAASGGEVGTAAQQQLQRLGVGVNQ